MTRLNDLSSISLFGGLTLSRLSAKEEAIEPRSHCVYATDQVSFSSRIQSLRGALWRQPEGPVILLLGSISHHGFRPTYLSRKLARYRSLSSGPASEALSLGLQWSGQTFHPGRRQRNSRLAYLSRLRAKPDPHSPATLCSFRVGTRTRCYRLRLRRYHYRPLSLALPLGQIQKTQGRDQVTHIAGDSQRYSHIYRYYRGELSTKSTSSTNSY
jgi:hypothetical protein